MSKDTDRMKERLVDALEETVQGKRAVMHYASGQLHIFRPYRMHEAIDRDDSGGVYLDGDKLADRVLADAREILAETPILIIHEDGRQDMVFPRQAELEAENEALKARVTELEDDLSDTRLLVEKGAGATVAAIIERMVDTDERSAVWWQGYEQGITIGELGERAKHGETISTAGMSDDEFLKALGITTEGSDDE